MPSPSPSDDTAPLVVDVDGALIAGDLSVESALRLIAASPLALFVLPLRLFRAGGCAALKRRIAREVVLPPTSLVLNPAVVDEISAARAAGREVWLVSGSDERAVAPLADAVGAAGHLGSDGRTNLTGSARAAALVDRFGEGGFDYIGNERRDLAIWKRARRAIGVGLSARLARDVRALDGAARFLPALGGRPVDFFRALRPHQWIKNVLVFVPLVAAHDTEAMRWAATGVLFVAFSALASGAYLLNDLFDLPHDRLHASKRHRPLAAGRVPLLPMMGVAAALMACGLGAAFGLSSAAGLALLLYLAATLFYSLWLKRRLFADVVALAMLYALRVAAGSIVASVSPSPYFLAFFVFFFLDLAVVKRLAELRALHEARRSEPAGRTYAVDDLPVIVALGAGAGFAALVVFALYVSGPAVSALYDRPEFLWLALPPLVYWLGRIMLLANRGKVDDPVVFAIRDPAAWLSFAAGAAAFAAAL